MEKMQDIPSLLVIDQRSIIQELLRYAFRGQLHVDVAFSHKQVLELINANRYATLVLSMEFLPLDELNLMVNEILARGAYQGIPMIGLSSRHRLGMPANPVAEHLANLHWLPFDLDAFRADVMQRITSGRSIPGNIP